jgi:hypothetical protein
MSELWERALKARKVERHERQLWWHFAASRRQAGEARANAEREKWAAEVAKVLTP